ncbi:MAG: hydrolase Cof [Haloplasmataceae bacterium]|jgi:Cof subfamily protein (haloacid dehalogenase superfamily)|nr:hydrolase Cof [Haloplasmataceae bacterium]
MNKQYLILLDLDGTALYDWQTLSNETIETVKKVKALGHIVAIATGRPFRSSKVFYDQLKLDTPIINYNGALVHHPFDDHFEKLETDIDIIHILKVFDEVGHLIENAFCEHYEDIYLYKMNDNIMPLIHPEGGKIITGDYKKTLKINPNGFILLAYPGKNVEIEQYLDDNFKGILDHRNWGGDSSHIIELFTPKMCKGIGMTYIANYYNIPLENVIAFGDGNNDIEMIRSAGIGVAMDNAVPNVKAVANAKTLSNKENGVAHFLTKFFKL